MVKFILISSLLFSQLTPEKNEERPDYRHLFIASEVVSGICLYSWLLPAGLGLEGRGAIALGLWTPAISLGASWMVKKVGSPSTPYHCLLGSINGMWRGFFMNPKETENAFMLPLALSIGENALGYVISEKYKFGVEDAQRHLNFTLLGISHAGMLQWLFEGGWGGWRYVYPILSAAEGYGLSLALSKQPNISFGDALSEWEFMRVGITSPLLFLGGLNCLISPEEGFSSKLYAGSALGGSILGALLGNKISNSRDISLGGSIITLLAPPIVEGMIYGTLVLLVPPEEWSDATIGITLISLSIGDAFGTWFLHKELSKPQEK